MSHTVKLLVIIFISAISTNIEKEPEELAFL